MLKQVIIIRKDLQMSLGKAIAQGAHASTNAALITPNNILEDWLEDSHTKVVVVCKNTEELIKLTDKAKEKGLPYSLIVDEGRTEFTQPTVTCGAIGPGDSEEIDKITKRLRLL